ncbi:MAG: hypothetical protein RL235_987, partial [Chlamydiota bacterium]
MAAVHTESGCRGWLRTTSILGVVGVVEEAVLKVVRAV